MEKLCAFCKHFGWDSIDRSSGDYGELYGGANCLKGYYTDERPYNVDDVREIFLRATNCADYSPPEATK